MKVGSLVECIHPFTSELSARLRLYGYGFPVVGGTYIVRGFQDKNDYNIYLDEIVNTPVPTTSGDFMEFGFAYTRFREIQPPMDISELIEECQTVSIEL